LGVFFLSGPALQSSFRSPALLVDHFHLSLHFPRQGKRLSTRFWVRSRSFVVALTSAQASTRLNGVTVGPYFRTTLLPTRSLLLSFIVGRNPLSNQFNSPWHSALINGTTSGLS